MMEPLEPPPAFNEPTTASSPAIRQGRRRLPWRGSGMTHDGMKRLALAVLGLSAALALPSAAEERLRPNFPTLDLGVRQDVQVPGGVLLRAAVGADDDVVALVLLVDQGGAVLRAGLAAAGREQQGRHPHLMCPFLPSVSTYVRMCFATQSTGLSCTSSSVVIVFLPLPWGARSTFTQPGRAAIEPISTVIMHPRRSSGRSGAT